MGSMTTPHLVEDFLGVLKLYSDGSIVREPIDRKIPIHDDGSAVWKDCLFHQRHNLQLRLYKPASSTHSSDGKLPIVYYIHAGGFCFGSRSHPNSHNSCLSLASGLRALVVAPDLRLAPEYRVPAAIDDAHGALTWLKAQALSGTSRDLWLCDDEVDFDRVFLLGDSSGGNVAHHLAVRLGPGSLELEPVRVRGYVLLSPFFGGTVPTVSELERPCEEFWNTDMYDRLWRLSLPGGATKDHPISNPFGPATSSLKDVGLDPILVVVGGDEILRDRTEDYVTGLKELGKEVSYVEFQGKQHGFFTSKSFSEEAKEVIQVFKDFIFKNSS